MRHRTEDNAALVSGHAARVTPSPLHLLVVVAEDELNPGNEVVSGDLTDACALPTDGARCRGSRKEGHSRVA